MTVTKKKRRIVLCGSSDNVSESSRSDSSIEFEQLQPKRPNLWTRIRNFFRERFPTRIRIRLRRPWRRTPKISDEVKVRRHSILAEPSLSIISEKLEENSEAPSAGSSWAELKTDDVLSSDVTLETDYFATSDTTIAPEKYSSCNFVQVKSDSSIAHSACSSKLKENVSLHVKQDDKTIEIRPCYENQNNSCKNEEQEEPKTVRLNTVEFSNSSHEQTESSSDEMSSVKELDVKVLGEDQIELPMKIAEKIDLKNIIFVPLASRYEKGRNMNANTEDGDSFSEDLEKQQKSSKKRVTFSEETFQQSYSSDSDTEHIKASWKFKKEHAVAREKIHPAVSKRANKLKTEKHFDIKIADEEKESSKKTKLVKKAAIETALGKVCEKPRISAWGSPMEVTEPGKDLVCLLKEIPIKAKTSTVGVGKVLSQPGVINIDRRTNLAETAWTTDGQVHKCSGRYSKGNLRANGLDTDTEQDKAEDSYGESRPIPIGSETEVESDGKMIGRYMIPNNSDNSSAEDLLTNQSDDFDINEIKKTAKSMVTTSTNLALDLIQGVDWGSQVSKEPTKYESNLSKISEEKEQAQEKQKNVLKKIYEEVYVNCKPPIYPIKEGQRSEVIVESKDEYEYEYEYEYESTDDENIVYDLPKPNKNNTVIVPKPRTKPSLVTDFKDCKQDKKKALRKLKSKDSNHVSDSSESVSQEEYTTEDLINDLDTCLADMQSQPLPPKPRDTTLAPNPFPVFKDNLPVVCPPKTDKPKYKRKKKSYKLLADNDDQPGLQRVSATAHLGKLKEVSNRQVPTPDIFLKTGTKDKCMIRYPDQEPIPSQKRSSVSYDNTISIPITNCQPPMGKLQPKGRDSGKVDVNCFFKDRSSQDVMSARQDEGEKTISQQSLYKLPDDLPDNLTPSQKKQYSRMQCTFRSNEECLPDAKFWTDIAKSGIQYGSKNSIDEKIVEVSDKHLPIAPIGYGSNVNVGISDSEAELNKLFFSTVVPQFYQKSDHKHHQSEDSLPSTKSLNEKPKGTPEENLDFFRNIASNPEFWSSSVDSKNKIPGHFLPKPPMKSTNDNVSYPINSRENLSFFKKVAKHPGFFQVGSQNEMMELPRSYFNEPPLGVEDELPGRRHSKEDENLHFFLSVSRNSSNFYAEPQGVYEEDHAPPSSPQGYHSHIGYIPDDPDNYVDKDTANDNLKFFKNLRKDIDVSKKKKKSGSKRSSNKKKGYLSSEELSVISTEKEDDTCKYFNEMSVKEEVRHE